MYSYVYRECRGRWTQWTKWETCTRTCGGGKQTRRRTCRPIDANLCWGYMKPTCKGVSSRSRNCNKKNCPGTDIVEERGESLIYCILQSLVDRQRRVACTSGQLGRRGRAAASLAAWAASSNENEAALSIPKRSTDHAIAKARKSKNWHAEPDVVGVRNLRESACAILRALRSRQRVAHVERLVLVFVNVR